MPHLVDEATNGVVFSIAIVVSVAVLWLRFHSCTVAGNSQATSELEATNRIRGTSKR
jgi:hypothetical protein